MSTALPDRVDIARQVQARRSYEGTLPLATLHRLAGSLANERGEVRYRVDFGKDSLGIACIDIHVETGLPLVCQRTLETFVWPVQLRERLGVIAHEAEEAALPEGYEPLLAPDGTLSVADVIEDELILALPVVPVKPGAPLEWNDPSADGTGGEAQADNPFAVLGALKKH
ncbi:YceD family protein [Dokdonella sp.]|uniref:YceD family protein n=1 Tax=Dokdonella sp. TaxID=2291710 RepID=UPI0031C72423|nr:YceD family protein [Dokdonella sp.]